MENIKIIHKDGCLENFKMEKVFAAISKSAAMVMVELTDDMLNSIAEIVSSLVSNEVGEDCIITVEKMHVIVVKALEKVCPAVAESYRNFRNYKQIFVDMMQKVYNASNKMRYHGDKSNSNADSCLVSTRRAIEEGYLSKELFQQFFLTSAERLAAKEGYIYVHDMSARRDTFNCCLFDMKSVMKGGFEMGNVHYNEPKDLDVAFDVGGDIVQAAGGQQYGGFTIPNVDEIFSYYAEKTYKKVFEAEYERLKNLFVVSGISESNANEIAITEAEKMAFAEVERQIRQGYQGWEMKFNTVASSRGDFPFVTITFGTDTSKWGKLISKVILDVHRHGQGANGKKKPVLFPKLVFLYDEKLHGEGGKNEDLFLEAVKTSSKAMYPDYLSLNGDTHVAMLWEKYHVAVSPMGCRAFLTPWYERGGMIPADDDDNVVIIGRANLGVVTLNPIMIVEEAKRTNVAWQELLEKYMQMARQIHIRTKAYLGNMRASMDPLGFCENGFYGGNLDMNDKIAPVIDKWTASFGFTGLNEAQLLMTGQSYEEASREYLKTCKENGVDEIEGIFFARDFVQYMNDFCEKWKFVDKTPYAVYGTPAESLTGLQVTQYLEKYGPNPYVTDKSFTTNSFHCDVRADVTASEKQDLEFPCWKFVKGGRIQYVKYPLGYNTEAIIAGVRRAMQKGYYEGVNLSLTYCDDCGYQDVRPNINVCPKCNSLHLTKIERMNGYLSYSRTPHGDTRLNSAKMEEISLRKSM